MQTNKKLRIFGGVVTAVAMVYYSYQIYLYIQNWFSLSEVEDQTSCTEIFALQIWLLSQNLLWLLSLSFLFVVLANPDYYKLLLCFLYFMGPVYLSWTVVAIIYYSSFLACCRGVEDGCTDYYPYYQPAGFIALIVVSLVFSSLITIYLFSIVIQALWSIFRHRLEQYVSLLN